MKYSKDYTGIYIYGTLTFTFPLGVKGLSDITVEYLKLYLIIDLAGTHT